MRLCTATACLLLLIIFVSKGQESNVVITPSGLRYTVLKPGSGEVAKKGNVVAIYESMGYLNGQQLYNVERPAPPIEFRLGKKEVIDGVDEGVTGMKVGEVRRLIVPPKLSKRDRYPDHLSKDSTLLYRVELVEIVKK